MSGFVIVLHSVTHMDLPHKRRDELIVLCKERMMLGCILRCVQLTSESDP